MKELTKDLFNFINWDSNFYSFQKAVTDSRPYQIVREDDKTTIVVNGLGIKKEDVKVTVDTEGSNDFLNITGETNNETLKRVFNINSRFSVDRDQIKNIDVEVSDGLVTIEVYWKKPERVNVDIKMK